MKNFSTILLVMFMVMFWILRIIVTLTTQMDIDFGGIVSLNPEWEVVTLFLTLLCIILVVKRKIIGALIYAVMYGMYFGVEAANNIKMYLETSSLDLGVMMNTLIALIGIILAISVLFDILVDKNRKANPKDNKTDWFFKNADFDRQYDERADRNQYKNL